MSVFFGMKLKWQVKRGFGYYCVSIFSRGVVEDTRLEAKSTKKIRGQGQPFRGQTLSRPRTGMLEAKAKDQGHRRKCSLKKKVFKNFFLAISKKKNRYSRKFSGNLQKRKTKKVFANFPPGFWRFPTKFK